jgi:hypothetical protein
LALPKCEALVFVTSKRRAKTYIFEARDKFESTKALGLFRDVFAGIDPYLDAQVKFGTFQKVGDLTTSKPV